MDDRLGSNNLYYRPLNAFKNAIKTLLTSSVGIKQIPLNVLFQRISRAYVHFVTKYCRKRFSKIHVQIRRVAAQIFVLHFVSSENEHKMKEINGFYSNNFNEGTEPIPFNNNKLNA